MPKVEAIINELENKNYDIIPEVSLILQSDIDRINEALRVQNNDRAYYAILKAVLSDVKRKLGHKDFVKPLIQISLSQLDGRPFIIDLKLRICEAIIESQELHRINILQHSVTELTSLNIADQSLRVRLEIVRAGKQYFKGDYTKAAIYYLNSSREEGLVKDEEKKIKLINKAIAFCYAAPRCPQNHRTICSLCLNEFSKKSHLKDVLNKLYMEDILTKSDCEKLEKELPAMFARKDNDGVSVLDQAMFSHNMIPIMNTFKVIKFGTLARLLSMTMDQVLVLLEKTYNAEHVKINQELDVIEFKEQVEEGSEKLKELLNKIDSIIQVQN